MHFTREPVVETVITPREGSKLVVRSSKGVEQEDYYVDAVEVVSFGNALFFRSKEKPKAFLVPVSDYEVIELKETRMVLKTAGIEKSIKIGRGKDNNNRSSSEAKDEKEDNQNDKKRDKKRSSKRRRDKEKKESKSKQENMAVEDQMPSSSVIRKLFPPPPILIKEKLLRSKANDAFDEEIVPGEEIEQEEFVIDESATPFAEKPYTEEFEKSTSDPEMLEAKEETAIKSSEPKEEEPSQE